MWESRGGGKVERGGAGGARLAGAETARGASCAGALPLYSEHFTCRTNSVVWTYLQKVTSKSKCGRVFEAPQTIFIITYTFKLLSFLTFLTNIMNSNVSLFVRLS